MFLDANVIRNSEVVTRLLPRPFSLPCGDRTVSGAIHDLVDRPRRSDLKDEALKEAELLPTVASLAKRGVVALVTGGEVMMETWGLPGSAGRRTVMEGAEIEWTDPPMEYSRPVAMDGGTPRDHRTEFIRSVRHPRFLEVANTCGAFDSNPPADNTLWDAFHVWWAEAAQARYFLTMDFRLTNRTSQKSKSKIPLHVTLVRPSELLRALDAVE